MRSPKWMKVQTTNRFILTVVIPQMETQTQTQMPQVVLPLHKKVDSVAGEDDVAMQSARSSFWSVFSFAVALSTL
jgi:hypothetical protein